jgi:amidohydrolase
MPRLPGVRPAVRKLTPSLVAARRHLHERPELSWQEHETQRYILERLRAIDGLEDVHAIAKTGATALVTGKKRRPCVAWRADIDALPIPERSGLPFASKNDGVMHACGHDAHVAIALAMAEALAADRAELDGSVRFIFQPAEEAAGGAPACIAAGVLQAPAVSTVLGLHISADTPVGMLNIAPGPFFAAPTYFRIEVTGRGGHGASPHQGIDAVVVAAHIVTALQSVVSRSVSPIEPAVLSVGTVNAGYRSNVIAESATLTGDIRSYTMETRDLLVERTRAIATGIAAAFDATVAFEFDTSCPPVVNDEQVTALVVDEANAYFGPANVFAAPTMGADDMAVFLEARPGAYFWLGARNEEQGIAGRHHDPGFVIDEDALPLGVEFGLRLVERALA